jgi:hypothetical protein
MGRGNPIPAEIRVGIDQRDQRRCVRCGSTSREQHHRQRRREGGHGFENLVSLCGADHRWAHANPSAARAQGFIVSVHEGAVESVPVLAYYGWVRLLSNGSIEWVPEKNGVVPDRP